MSFVGYIYGKFTSDHRLEIVDIYFNGIDLRRKLLCTFGSSIYRPMTLANDIIVGEPSSFADVSQVVTILPDTAAVAAAAVDSSDSAATEGECSRRLLLRSSSDKLSNTPFNMPFTTSSNIYPLAHLLTLFPTSTNIPSHLHSHIP